MLKLSNFLQKKRIEFIEGKPVEVNPTLDGSITLNDIDEKTIKLIIKNVMKVLTEEELKDDTLFMYKIIPYMFEDLEIDITLEQFSDLVKYPKNHFELLLEMLMNEINELFDRADKLNKMQEKSNIVLEKTKEIKRLNENKELMESVKKSKPKAPRVKRVTKKKEKCE